MLASRSRDLSEGEAIVEPSESFIASYLLQLLSMTGANRRLDP
jgi:hypothetical protein